MHKTWKRFLVGVCVAAMGAGMVGPFHVPARQVQAEEKEEAPQGRTVLNFNSDWGFYRGDLKGAEAIDYDDSAFVNVTVPHTMRLEQKHNNTVNGVYKGVGWYRRYFTLDQSYEGKKLQLQFEGVMTDSDVYLNGEKIYTRNGGYVGFTVDITDKVKLGEENVLALRVSNEDNPNTPPGKPDANLDFHYYGGIYRDVRLIASEKTYVTDALAADEVAGGGIFVTYPEVSKEQAKVHVKTQVKNDNEENKTVYTKQVLKDKKGKVAAESKAEDVELAAGKDVYFEQELSVEKPNLWSIDTPYLYQLVTEVYENDVKVDEVTTKVGIRRIEYKPDGFYLNGEHIYLRGGNRHQCYQNVGDAASNSMQYRDALQIKEDGFNAVRATHYPNDPAFLDACDEIGLVVIECQPGWQNFTDTEEFYQNSIRDTREMIRRDRNRPSVVLWETSLNESYSTPERWAKEATEAAHEEYPGDQIFTASDFGLFGKQYYDVCYKVQDTNIGDQDPNMPFFTREWGDWEGSSKALRKQGEGQMNTQIYTRQRYLNGAGYPDWGGLDASDRIGGYFVWSWNDHTRGSNTVSAGSGSVDIDRYEKNCFYWFQSMQPKDNPVYGPMVYISSDYTENSSLTVPVFSNCDSVKLYQNGSLVKEITREEAGKNVPNIMKKGGSPIFEFQLEAFKAGTLKAEGIVDGEVVTEYEVRTPEEAVTFELEVRDRGIQPVADGSDLIPVYVKAVDKNGTIVPDYDGKVHLEVTGNGTLVGENMPRIKVQDQKLEKGIGFAFVKASDIAGDITVTASAENMKDAATTTTTQECKETFVPTVEGKGWENNEDSLEEPVLENIAVGKPVQVSSEQEGNAKEKIVDDDDSTRWCAEGSSMPQWVEVDLKKAENIAGFQMLWENASDVYQYTIEVSNDRIHWKNALDKSDNQEVNTGCETQMVKAQGRFVRLNITGTKKGWASLFEFRIVPDHDAEAAVPGEEIPDDAIAEITASEGSAEGRGTELVRDGITDVGTGWLSPNGDTFPQTLEMRFKEPQTLLGNAVYWEKDSTKITYDIEVTKDGENWEPVMTDLEETWHDEEPETFEEIQENVIGIRVVMKGKAPIEASLGMAEWLVYGYPYEEPDPEPEKEYEYLSDLAWTDAHSDFGQVKKDEAAYNGGLVLNTPDGPKEFEKGLGADTNSYIIYNVEGKKYYKFESYIGINKGAVKNGGEAIFKVYIDDEMVYESPVKMRDDNCEFVSVEIPENVKTVKLEAVWHPNPDNPEARYNTHVDWADAKFFIKQTTYQVVAESEDEKMGTVSLDKEDGIYAKGTKATATATAKEGYQFAGWVKEGSDEILSEEAVYEFVVKEDVHLIGIFEKVESPVDKTKLQKKVDDSTKYEDSIQEYTPATADIFTEALVNARNILAKEDATQEEIDAAYAQLQNAVFGLRLIPDKSKLEDLIQDAEKVDTSKYTEESANAFTAALNHAKEVFADENATEEDVKAAEEGLKVAKENLVVKADEGNSGAGNDNNQNNNNQGTNNDSSTVKTGDQTSWGVYLMIAVLAVAAGGARVIFRSKRG